MSFADEMRFELCALVQKKNCCRRALLSGLLLHATRTDATNITLTLSNEAVARLACELLMGLYGKMPEMRRVGSHGHYKWNLTYSSPSCAKLVSALTGEHADLDEILKLSSCDGCRSSFLRGLFLSCGTVSDPQKMSHMEFLFENEASCSVARTFFGGLGYLPRRIKRRDRTGLYYKDGEGIGDLAALMGVHHILYAFYDARIAREIRNNENRATNCVARNIEKSVAASARQMEAIGLLMEHGRLDALPETLKDTAWLRYRNPDATLDELKDMHKPPISKSGLNHRLQKLMDEAKEYMDQRRRT